MEQAIAKLTVEQGMSWAQIFYYSMGGLAALAVAVKTVFVVIKRRSKK